MQLVKSKSKFDFKSLEQLLLKENEFIKNLFNVAALPERRGDEDDEENENQSNGPTLNNKKTSRAKSFEELHQRLEAITSKKKLTYKEKLTRKGLKSRMKKKSKQDERNAQQKLKRAAKLTGKTEEIKVENGEQNEEKPKTSKPVFNSEDKMVFSKFDFANLGKKKEKKVEKDPKKLLKKLTEEKSMLKKLEESGEVEKVVEIKEKTAWKNALAKAEGQKVKDDPTLLKKTMKRQEQKHRSSKKKWQARIEGVQKSKDEKQKKRTENIDKRKKDKKVKKLKNSSKRGKIIPGF